jgi:DNA-binding NarL/FixJ family response regulator
VTGPPRATAPTASIDRRRHHLSGGTVVAGPYSADVAIEDDRDIGGEPVERRAEERRRADVPVPVDRRQSDRRASRLAPEQRFAGVAVVVDTWPLMRAGIRFLLEDRGFRVAADTAATADAARAVGDRLDLAVIGSTADDPLHAVERVRRLPAAAGGPPAVVLLMERVDAGDLRRLLAVGVEGIVQRSIGMDDLGAACERVMAGHRVLTGGPLSVLASTGLQLADATAANRSSATPDAGDPGALTRKELEVLGHLANHHSNAEIAARMHVSAATVKTHLSNIYGKLGVASRREAVVVGVQRGLLT